MNDQLPPHSIESEQALLGCMIQDRECVTKASVFPKEIFYDLRHRTIWENLVSLERNGDPTDILPLVTRMKEQNQLEAVGGIAYVSSLTDVGAGPMMFDYFFTKLMEVLTKRKLLALASTINLAVENQSESSEVIDKSLLQLIELQRGTARKDSVRPLGDFVTSALADFERIYSAGGGIDGIATGFPDLDRIIGGLNPPDYFIIGARPSFGKTALSMNIAENIALKSDIPVGVLSLEMSGSQLAKRMMLGRSGITIQQLRNGRLSEQDFKRLFSGSSELKRAKIVISDVSMALPDIRRIAREMVAKHQVKVVVLDYLQLAQSTKGENRNAQITEISNGIKALAKELNLVWIVLSQLSRDIEQNGKGREPRLSDLRDSGAIEQDADIIGLLHQKETLEKTKDMLLIIAKHRNGATGAVPLVFEKETTTFKSGVTAPYRDD